MKENTSEQPTIQSHIEFRRIHLIFDEEEFHMHWIIVGASDLSVERGYAEYDLSGQTEKAGRRGTTRSEDDATRRRQTESQRAGKDSRRVIDARKRKDA